MRCLGLLRLRPFFDFEPDVLIRLCVTLPYHHEDIDHLVHVYFDMCICSLGSSFLDIMFLVTTQIADQASFNLLFSCLHHLNQSINSLLSLLLCSWQVVATSAWEGVFVLQHSLAAHLGLLVLRCGRNRGTGRRRGRGRRKGGRAKRSDSPCRFRRRGGINDCSW